LLLTSSSSAVAPLDFSAQSKQASEDGKSSSSNTPNESARRSRFQVADAVTSQTYTRDPNHFSQPIHTSASRHSRVTAPGISSVSLNDTASLITRRSSGNCFVTEVRNR